MSGRKKQDTEQRARRQEARARVVHLREILRDARAAKKRRMRELSVAIRAERAALRDRLRVLRRQALVTLREAMRQERVAASTAWNERRLRAREEASTDVERVRAEMNAERAHFAEMRRIDREERAHRVKHARNLQADEDVRALIPTQLVPLFDQLKKAVRGAANESRAEAFLRLAASRPDDVFKIVEPHVERIIAETLAELTRTERVAMTGRVVLGPGLRASNTNSIIRKASDEAGPDEFKRALKGEGLDTTQIAKAIRGEIKEAVQRKALPRAHYSVKTDKYSMGSSITVVASKLPFPTINADAFYAEKGANFVRFDSTRFRSRLTPKAQDVERKLEALVGAYHWNRSDSSSDYYNERFARHISVAEDPGEWKRMEAAKIAAVREAES